MIYTVYHNGAANTISVDQTTIASGQWRLIDTAYFAAGNDQYVMLTAGSLSGSGNISRADAVMLEPVNFGDLFQGNSTAEWTANSGVWSAADDISKVLKQSSPGIAETRAGETYSNVAVTMAIKAFDKAVIPHLDWSHGQAPISRASIPCASIMIRTKSAYREETAAGRNSGRRNMRQALVPGICCGWSCAAVRLSGMSPAFEKSA